MKYRPHINIPVSNLRESISFYEKIFGVPPTKVKEDYANFRLSDPAIHLALVYKPNLAKRPIQNGEDQHFGIEVFSDADFVDLKERVKSTGLVPTLEEENITCCYAKANKFWLQDHDGNEWEFWVRQDEAETMHEEKARSCCPTK